MFQLKNSGSGSEDPSLANKLPNFHGKVRTFKEDTENFEKGHSGQTAVGEEHHFYSSAEKNISPHQSSTDDRSGQQQPIFPRQESQTENPFQSMPTPPPLSAGSDFPDSKSSPSQSFFSEKPFASENVLPPQAEKPSSPQKSRKAIFISLAILFAIIIAAAGFYYYWFYIKSTAPAVPANPVADKTTSPETTPSPNAASDNSKNNNLRKMVVDTSKNPAEIKTATTTFATNFVSTASEGDLIEVKTLNQENQPIGKKDFFAGFSITVPDAVIMKLSEDYSLFVKKEGGAAKLGLVFKTVTSAGLAEEMKNWEPTMTNDLGPIFAGQIPTGAGPFNSSRYNNADIRYSNFSSPADTSLDYSVIANFLVIGTSKDTTRATLDYMSQK
ncbi:MAG: hypothetical protein NT093_04565 [Candidatus Moranbacteria bacterium]|nr:hypothetical protein [Candidatus Moranbacteria bacterium]